MAASVIGALAALTVVIVLIVALVTTQRKKGWVTFTLPEDTLT